MQYMKELFSRINEWLKKKERKKVVENCAVLLIIGIILILAAGPLLGGKEEENMEKARETAENKGIANNTSSIPEPLERKMEAILSNMEGAGKVEVMITYYASAEKVPAFDVSKSSSDTDESDAEGGRRTLTQSEYKSTIIYEDTSGGGKQPVILKEINPQVRGVVIVADGAGDTLMRERLARAATVLLDVPIHRVQVFKREK